MESQNGDQLRASRAKKRRAGSPGDIVYTLDQAVSQLSQNKNGHYYEPMTTPSPFFLLKLL